MKIMSNKDNKGLSRRDFLKILGLAGAAGAGITACSRSGSESVATAEIPTDKMTYRTNPKTGQKISLLGFGMMRLPSVGGRSAP